MSFQGIELTPEMRQLVVNVKHFFDQNTQNPGVLQSSATVLPALALGISESTVKVVMSAFNKNGVDGLAWGHKNARGRPSFVVEPGIESVIRKFVRKANKGKELCKNKLNDYWNYDMLLACKTKMLHCQL